MERLYSIEFNEVENPENIISIEKKFSVSLPTFLDVSDEINRVTTYLDEATGISYTLGG
jgi:hypothetical protein